MQGLQSPSDLVIHAQQLQQGQLGVCTDITSIGSAHKHADQH